MIPEKDLLLHDAQQWSPALRRLRIARPLGPRLLVRDHFVAQSLEILVIDGVELHPKLEHGNRNELRRFTVATGDERGAAGFKSGKNR